MSECGLSHHLYPLPVITQTSLCPSPHGYVSVGRQTRSALKEVLCTTDRAFLIPVILPPLITPVQAAPTVHGLPHKQAPTPVTGHEPLARAAFRPPPPPHTRRARPELGTD